jgi:two-component system chemotaxis response regulator CheB
MENPSVVVMAASSGGLAAMETILAALPARFPAAILIAQHRAPDFPAALEEQLGRVTSLTAKTAEQGDAILPGTAFVAPPIIIYYNGPRKS